MRLQTLEPVQRQLTEFVQQFAPLIGRKEIFNAFESKLQLLFLTFVYRAHERWNVEQNSQELKEELRLHHYEGRSCNGLHHHISLPVPESLGKHVTRSVKESSLFRVPRTQCRAVSSDEEKH